MTTTFKKITRALAGVAACGLMGLFSTAVAAPVTWTLTDVEIDDGGIGTPSLTGAFTFDAETGVYSDIFLELTNPSAPFRDATVQFFTSGNAVDFRASDRMGDQSGALQIRFIFTEQLTDMGGAIAISAISVSNCLNATCTSRQQGIASISEGSLSGSVVGSAASVPLPMSAWLLVTGLGALGTARKLKRSAS